ncbi:hypothetical protein NA56DRAFT_703389 [Hyaloscypha hepaticicola]|uniref:Uncharacterized protein n=1 Tax=Hyaloscypha hepaticicola TaxID=2082293 RepID=A0A2J6Q673_9HELO|nr:hypothetical protein NA56DRAFT_703389 [Hyaloscypha hepaticicola]
MPQKSRLHGKCTSYWCKFCGTDHKQFPCPPYGLWHPIVSCLYGNPPHRGPCEPPGPGGWWPDVKREAGQGHSARDCQTLDTFLPLLLGTHYPQTYQPSSSISLLNEEISTAPPYQPPFQPSYILEQGIARWQYKYGYLQTEIACKRLKMQDRDGDVIMENSWLCGQDWLPARVEDGWERWGGALLLCSEPSQGVVWVGCY